jgi:hypothetical protein
MSARLRALAALLVLFGCGWDEVGNAPSPSQRGGPREVTVAPPRPPPAPAAPAQPQLAQQPQPAADRPSMFKPAAAKTEEEAKKEPARDYPAELLAAVGTPVSCFKPRVGPEAPPEIRIALDVHVIESGMVTRAYARSAQLDESELDCVRKRLGALRLRAPVDAAPRSISATLELKLKLKTSEKSGP